MVERLMNELAGIWIDALGKSKKMKASIWEDLENMCPGVVWEWVKDHNGHLIKIKVTGFKQPPDPTFLTKEKV